MRIWRQLLETAQRLFAPSEDVSGEPPDPETQIDFTIGVIGLGAKLAKADGRVTRDEIRAFERVFAVPEDARADAARVFDLARRTTLGYQGYARRLARRWRSYPSLLEDVLDGLFYIAAADGIISPEELGFLAEVAGIFGLSDAEFMRIRASWIGPDDDDPYLVLGVDRDISDVDLKRAYRRLAGANHPDRFASRGLPTSAERIATAKMAAINAAYAKIRHERGARTKSTH